MDAKETVLTKEVTPLFQCIVDFRTQKEIGFEAFSHIEDEKIEEVIKEAEVEENISFVEHQLQKKIVKTARALGIKRNLFLNVSPFEKAGLSQGSDSLLSRLREYSILAEHVYLEINLEEDFDPEKVKELLKLYHELGFKTVLKIKKLVQKVIDCLVDLKTECIKIVYRPEDEKFIRYLSQYCFSTNTLLVAEKIEYIGHLKELLNLGIMAGQGYYISKPEIYLPKCSPQSYSVMTKHILSNQAAKKNGIKEMDREGKRPISDILSYGDTMLEEENAVDALKLLHNKADCPMIAVLDDKDMIKGVIPRAYLLDLFSGQYGFGLHSKKKVFEIMKKDFLAVEKNEAVENVVSAATARDKDQVYSPVVIVDKGVYQGIITIKDLMESIINIEVNGRTLEISKKNAQLEEQQKMMNRDLKMAEHVQKSFYISRPPVLDDWEIAFEFRPLNNVSGDLYDFYWTDKKLEGISLFDVSGHGVASALVGILAKSISQKKFIEGKNKDLCTVMGEINKSIIEEKGSVENYMTGVVLRIKENVIEYVNAGHTDILVKNKKTAVLGNKNKTFRNRFLGIPDLPVDFNSMTARVPAETYFLLYTDCLTESRNLAGDELGIDLLKKVFDRSKGNTAKDVLKDVIESFDAFTEAVPVKDDLTVIVLKYNGRKSA